MKNQTNNDILIIAELLKEHGIEYRRIIDTLYAWQKKRLCDPNNINGDWYSEVPRFPIFTSRWTYFPSISKSIMCKKIDIADPDFIDKLKKKIEICKERRPEIYNSCNGCPYHRGNLNE